MTKIIAVANQKGGVGKSTTALSFGVGLKKRGFQILFVDLDSQGNLSYTAQADTDGISSLELLTSGADPASAVQCKSCGDVIACSPSLAGADSLLTEIGKEYRLKEALQSLQRYDYILVDTPPALGILTINALAAADLAIIPAQADVYSLQGIGQLTETIHAVRQYCNPALKIDGILLTRFNARAILSRDIADVVESTAAQLHTRLYKTRIRENIAIREAQANRLDIFSYAPRSHAAEDYDRFITEFLREEQQ